MDKQSWYDERDDRLIRYGARRLDAAQWIAITADPEYLARPDGQAAILTACNLLSRMTPSVAIAFDDKPIHASMPWAGRSLHDVALDQMRGADIHAAFCVRPASEADFRFHLGRTGGTVNAHGSSWNAWFGTKGSPLPDSEAANCTGGCFAVILAASRLFIHGFHTVFNEFSANTLNWRSDFAVNPPQLGDKIHPGSVWTLGAGSVGTAALYFLTLVTRNYRAVLIDMDRVKLHNITRSPIFTHDALRELKVDVTKTFLRGAGVADIRTDDKPLDESGLWLQRQAGEADVVIAAANERQARYHIEARFPPIQIYATTGGSYQTTLFRHVPGASSCSLCQFPKDQAYAATHCATDPQAAEKGEQADASLPFLSFAAGLMTAAEILKLGLPGYPFSPDRVFLNTRPEITFFGRNLGHRAGCLCEERNANVLCRMNAGSKYEGLSP